jgi:hypothetical protein
VELIGPKPKATKIKNMPKQSKAGCKKRIRFERRNETKKEDKKENKPKPVNLNQPNISQHLHTHTNPREF